MFGIILISHGELAAEFLNTCTLIAGVQKNIEAVGLYSDESREDMQSKLKAAADRLYTEEGLLILADLYGGTPCNAAILELLKNYEKIKILTGLNLSMLLEAVIHRENLREASALIKETGREGITDIMDCLYLECDE